MLFCSIIALLLVPHRFEHVRTPPCTSFRSFFSRFQDQTQLEALFDMALSALSTAGNCPLCLSARPPAASLPESSRQSGFRQELLSSFPALLLKRCRDRAPAIRRHCNRQHREPWNRLQENFWNAAKCGQSNTSGSLYKGAGRLHRGAL